MKYSWMPSWGVYTLKKKKEVISVWIRLCQNAEKTAITGYFVLPERLEIALTKFIPLPNGGARYILSPELFFGVFYILY